MLWFQCRIWTIPKKFDSGDILINMLFSLAYIATKGWPQPNILATGSSVVATAGMAGKSHVIGGGVNLGNYADKGFESALPFHFLLVPVFLLPQPLTSQILQKMKEFFTSF